MCRTRLISQEIEIELKKLLTSTEDNVKICVAWINMSLFNDVFQKLITKGVTIEIICNDDSTNKKYANPVPDGVNIYFYKPLKRGINHNKFMIIDNKILCNGSYNWSKNAANNLENIIVIENDIDLIAGFNKMFEEFKSGLSIRDLGQTNLTGTCKFCRSTTYNLLLISYLDIRYQIEEDTNYILTICQKNNHIDKILEDKPDFSGEIFLDEPEYEDSIEELSEENKNWHRSMLHYKDKYGIHIHLIGMIDSNHGTYLKGYDSLKQWLKICWRDPNYTNMIPNNIDIQLVADKL